MIDVIIKDADNYDVIHVNEMMFHSLSCCGYTNQELSKIMNFYKIDEEYLVMHRINLAYHNKIFVGFFSLIKNSNQENELDYFIIKKDLIGLGYGRRMWGVCCSKARSLLMKDFIIMSTPHAKNFYQKMGAQEIGACQSMIREGVSLPLLKFSL
jgi:predicted GNAT family N-acyltransferase